MLDLIRVRALLRVIGTACLVATAASAQPVLPQDGTYLSTAYLAALETTKSHLAAASKTASPQEVIVSRDAAGGVELNSVVGWFETATAVYSPNTPTVFEDPESGAKKPFIWIDATHFRIGRGEGQLTYRYVGDEQHILIGKLLAGTYTDARGRKYVFGADGKAQFPDRAFRFEILTNVLDEEWDQIVEHTGEKEGDRNFLAFAWRGTALFLYPCRDGDSAGCTADRKHPIAALHRLPLTR
jgi:hypothetical protein